MGLQQIMLRCPSCKRTMMVNRDESDPLIAEVLEMDCEKCEPDTSKFEQVHYFANDGSEVAAS